MDGGYDVTNCVNLETNQSNLEGFIGKLEQI